VIQREPKPGELLGQNQYMLVTSDRAPHLTPGYFEKVMRKADFVMAQKQPRPESLHEAMPPGTFWDSPLYREYLEPQNIKYVMMVDVYRSTSVCMKLIIERGADQADFDQHEKDVLEAVAPHLSRAFLHQSGLEPGFRLQTIYEHILDKLDLGCILLDKEGGVLSLNRAAKRVVDAKIGLRICEGRLVAAESTLEQQELRKAVKLAVAASRNQCSSQPGVVIGMHSQSGMLELEVVVKPYLMAQLSTTERPAAAAVFISRSSLEDKPSDFQVLAELYGFTKQEAKVAALIGAGLSVSDLAGKMCVSINTAKTHLRGIYAKTGFNRQSQIVSLVARSSARLL
jgi:DNA-binding CsgD family transcriptional regulator